MPTLWQMLTKKKEEEEVAVPVEDQHYNPLGAKIGQHVKIDTLEMEEFDFNIRSLQAWTRHIGGEKFKHADYLLIARPIGGDEVKKKVRLVPMEDPDGKMTHNVVLLNLLDEFEYDQEFHEGLDFDRNGGEFHEGEAIYYRVQDVRDPFKARIKHISDLVGDGEVEEEEVRDSTVVYWDFWRETEDDGGNTIIEFYIVEMDDDCGWFRIWVGGEIDQNRVSIT